MSYRFLSILTSRKKLLFYLSTLRLFNLNVKYFSGIGFELERTTFTTRKWMMSFTLFYLQDPFLVLLQNNLGIPRNSLNLLDLLALNVQHLLAILNRSKGELPNIVATCFLLEWELERWCPQLRLVGEALSWFKGSFHTFLELQNPFFFKNDVIFLTGLFAYYRSFSSSYSPLLLFR